MNRPTRRPPQEKEGTDWYDEGYSAGYLFGHSVGSRQYSNKVRMLFALGALIALLQLLNYFNH